MSDIPGRHGSERVKCAMNCTNNTIATLNAFIYLSKYAKSFTYIQYT